MSRRHKWYFGIKAVAAAFIFFCTLVTLMTAAPMIETRFFPVLDKLEILTVEPLGENLSRVRAAFRKKRNCAYLGIAWYRGKQGDEFERVSVALGRDPGDVSSPNRPVGYQKAGPWDIGMPADEVRGNSFVEVYHQCFFAWTTRTEFYP